MKLICSAAYVEQDLASEFGMLPPAFLPVGNKRLYEYQIDFLSAVEGDVYLSLPETFLVPEHDRERLAELGVRTIFVPDGLSLGNSVLYAWAATGVVYEKLCILHGDTLFSDFRLVADDFVSVHPNFGSYRRARIDAAEDRYGHYISDFVDDARMVLSGLFYFSRPPALMQGIVYAKGDFVAGIERYRATGNLREISGGLWLDFGHLNSFFKSRSLMTTQRAFNDLWVTSRTVTKSSHDARKMYAESNWFENLPPELRLHVPALIKPAIEGVGRVEYTTEYLYFLPLNDLFVYGKLPLHFWASVFKIAREITSEFRRHKPDCVDLKKVEALYLPKTLARLSAPEIGRMAGVPRFNGCSGLEALQALALEAGKYITSVEEKHIGIVHGDYCFSNLLFDSRTQALKLIDPRGLDSNGDLTIYGDTRYDVAKLFHSAVGGYDQIIAGRYRIGDEVIVFSDLERLDEAETMFERVFFEDGFCNRSETVAIAVLLFISMLPLHSDRPDRQRAMMLNAFRLFHKISS